ncbi:MAG: sterol-binding protein [Proteobacteria bacterium]|nr:sterol-binding protein [Pseudomonadota bacterium]
MLAGTPWAFARMGLSESPEQSLFGGEVRIEGDADTARRFRTLLEAVHIDWEGQLANVLGDGVAEWVFGALRAGRRWGDETLETFGLNVAEYLQEESRDLPAVAEADEFLRNVDTLRADCDRLEARIERLVATVEPASGSSHSAQG